MEKLRQEFSARIEGARLELCGQMEFPSGRAGQKQKKSRARLVHLEKAVAACLFLRSIIFLWVEVLPPGLILPANQ
jgi:hypothetical protein